MELLLMIDAAKRSSAGKIIAVIPSYGYARQDKKEGIRGPMGAKLVADLLSAAGIDGLITIDLHADAIQGFFNVPVNHINGFSIFSDELKKIIDINKEEYIVCSPDAGGAVRANKFAKRLGLGGAIAINKERDKPGSISKMLLMADVIEKKIILIDDMCDSGGTLCKAADYLIKEKKAKSVIAVCTHPIFSGNAIEKISVTENLSELYVSDTLDFDTKLLEFNALWSKTGGGEEYKSDKIKTVSCSTILAKIIARISKGESIDKVN
jgi:ribose-phosphate pyrophosphokinase